MNLVDNPITVHFIHRGIGYLLLIGFLVLTVQLHRIQATPLLRKLKWIPLSLVLLQVVLGILSVLTSTGIIPGVWGVFEWMAQLHQLVAMLLLLSLVSLFYLIRAKA